MTKVIAWPEVGVIGSEWTTVQPVSVSRSLITGARFVSQFQRERRVVTLNVSALGRGRMGAGYMEVLKRLLAGGANLVRLNSYPVNWYNDAAADSAGRSAYPIEWVADDTYVEGDPVMGGGLRWFTGTVLRGVPDTDGVWNVVNVTGLPRRRLVARPGEFLTVFADLDDKIGATVQIMAPAYSNGGGAAVIRVMDPLPHSGRVNIGGSDTAVFEAVTIPRAAQGLGADWSYAWEFKEVFEDEVPGGFEEVNPWN